MLKKAMYSAPLMRGKGYSAQIDESLFQGRRKYNRGRLLTGNKKTEESMCHRLRSYTKPNKESKKSKRNYGSRVQGPWVFGIVISKIPFQ